MHFVKSADSSLGQNDLSEALSKSLSEGQVLWLLTGGSNVQITVNVLDQLEDSLTCNLNILLADERYGPAGHPDSNYTKLVRAGLNLKQATFPDVLAGDLDPEETVKKYTELFNSYKDQSKTVIAQLGIGEDGHIAGVLPFSPGVSSSETIVYFEASDFKRLTLSLNALKEVNMSLIFCFGSNKSQALKRLAGGQESLEALPSLILKQMPEVTVYNDQLEEG
ncbi:MAG TPA: 6-phosphogluconolactonase [Candidatus Saccharimonadales bacterium]|jgi:6-phosphogluconolactonase/glucosamine-6-phosphate isomerase/deaminase